MKHIVVDIDDTICFPNHDAKDSHEKYGKARPNVDMIVSLQKARERGCKITLMTARRMATHNGDLEKIIADVGAITERWLDEYAVPYDDLIFGKPFADYYIDDKALRPEEFVQIQLRPEEFVEMSE